MANPVNPESKEAQAIRLYETRMAYMDNVDNQEKFCADVGIPTNRWRNAENAYNRLGMEDLLVLCRVIGITTDWVIRGDKQLLKADFREKLARVPAKTDRGRQKSAKRA